MKFFEKKLLKLSDSERNLMGMLIAEARRCIKTPLDDPYTEKMEKKEDFLFGSQQLILKVVIMHLLLCLNYYVKCLLQKVKDLKGYVL